MKALNKKNIFVCTPRSFCKITKDFVCAGLLGQLYYWGITTDDEWFDHTQAEIFDITSITSKQQDTARAKLEEMGFIEVERRGIPARLFYKINFESIELAHEMIEFPLPKYRKNQVTEKNLPSKKDGLLSHEEEVKITSTSFTYSLANAQKINPETLEVAKQVCVKLEAMGIDRVPSSDDPILLFAVECGGTVEQFESSAKVVLKDEAKANFNYVVAKVRGRIEDASRLAANTVVRGKPRAVYQGSSSAPIHASHVIEQPKAPEPPVELLRPGRLNDALAMLSKPRSW